jgi:hypothetical protein
MDYPGVIPYMPHIIHRMAGIRRLWSWYTIYAAYMQYHVLAYWCIGHRMAVIQRIHDDPPRSRQAHGGVQQDVPLPYPAHAHTLQPLPPVSALSAAYTRVFSRMLLVIAATTLNTHTRILVNLARPSIFEEDALSAPCATARPAESQRGNSSASIQT